MKLAPALAAGCTMVLKAAPETALDALIFGEAAAEAGLPPGVLNIVAGGPAAGAHLVEHRGVDTVAFTGSTAAGRLIGETCGRLMRPVTLELGGKSAAIVLDDADLDPTMRALKYVSFVNNGQTCHLNSRILAPRSRYEEVVGAVAALAAGLTVGDPLDRPPTSIRSSAPGSANGCSSTSKSASPKGRNWWRAARFRPISRAAGSSRQRCSPTSITAPASHRRRSSARCSPSSPTRTIAMPSTSPMTPSSALAARCGRPTSNAPPR
jgi:hypothetical protein